MQIIQPSVEIEVQDWGKLLKRIEKKGRVCYKSEAHIAEDSMEEFIKKLIRLGHFSVLEHEKLSIKFIVDRGISHELVRHWSASFSQESTRYCNYGHESEITVIQPFFYEPGTTKYDIWLRGCYASELAYLSLLDAGSKPQEARDVLVSSLKTEVWMTATVKDWLVSILPQRCSSKAHPQMQQVMIPTLRKLRDILLPVFPGVAYNVAFPVEHYAEVTVVD